MTFWLARRIKELQQAAFVHGEKSLETILFCCSTNYFTRPAHTVFSFYRPSIIIIIIYLESKLPGKDFNSGAGQLITGTLKALL